MPLPKKDFGAVKHKPKGIIYGAPGVGKSTFAANIPGHYIIDCNDGLRALAVNHNINASDYQTTWRGVYDILRTLATEDLPEIQAVVIDTLDDLIRLIIQDVAGTDITATLNKAHGGYGNGKQVLSNHINNVLKPILNKINDKGRAVILLGHASRTDITDEEGITVEKTVANLPKDFLNDLVGWADFVNLAYKDDSGARILITEDTRFCMAKNRYGFPPEISFNWENFVMHFSAHCAKGGVK